MKLTLSQKDIYNEQLLFPDLPIYNIGGKIEIKGFICTKTLYKACSQFIEDHDSYRMIVKEESEEPQIEFLEKYDFQIDYKDFSDLIDARENAEVYLKKEFSIPFSFSNQKLLNRFILVKMSDDFHCLFTYYHHIITDGWGSSLMIQRIIQNYNEMFTHGKTISTYDFKYQDYILEDNEYQKSKTYENDKNYWTNKFINNIPDQIFRKKISSTALLKSEREELIIDRSFYNELLKFCEDKNTTFFHFILASLFSYMGISRSLDAMAIGIPTLNRSSRKYKKTVGLFAGISPLKINLNDSETFTDLLKTISRELRDDYRHQRFPFGKLMNELNLSDPNELFNIVLSYEKHDYAHHFVDTITEVIPFNHGLERVAMAIYIREWYDNDNVRIHFDYNRNYLDKEEISNFIENFFYFIKKVLIEYEKPLNELSYLIPSDVDKLLYGFNQTYIAYPQDKTVIDLFESQVLSTPDNIALIFEGTELSYRDLDERSNQFAHYLRSQYNIGRDDLVGVQLERSSDFVITILGILKSGGAYVPIDPSYPLDRISYMKEDSGCKVVVDIEELLLFKIEMADYSVLPVEHRSEPDDLVYVIYTSGSTGRPKGVMVEHGGVLNMVLSQIREFGLVNSDVVFLFASIAFDASFSEIMMSLLSGARLFISEAHALKDKNKFVEILRSSGTSVITLPPAYSEILSLEDLSGLRVLISAGESSSIEKGLSLCGDLSYFNAYGPTECSVCSSIYHLSKEDSWRKSIPIGFPISNTRMYILSEGGNLCPLGVVGEICISGAGLARGYLNNELLTNEKFVSNRYVPGERMYKTGDLGRWLPDGSIEYIGRKDSQVKIRGYRIELGEIEFALQGYPDVTGSVVLAVENVEGHKELAAYITGSADLSSVSLREYLRGVLPDYMVPGHYIQVESFPLTSNGKLDRKSLPDAFGSSLGSGVEYVAARNGTEEKLISIWEDVLGKSGIGIKDNFFELGGHSLKVARLSTLIHQTFDIKISVQEIFNESTIEKQRILLDSRGYQKYISLPSAPILDFYPLSSSQRRLWLMSGFSGASGAYNIPAVFRISGDLDINSLKKSYFSLLSRHEILRTVFRETIDGVGCQVVLPEAQPDSFSYFLLDFVSEKQVIEEVISQETGRVF
ncbi:amino acid adenylation domain-containing protein, partial [Chryseobacterium sp. NRRL B-14859]|uniref:non-ribosomal peptide synthetase n=1 Tax=Chryseobacterium sp. NRRL B-14859 TaxID=1562763 RepID=UPI00339A4030